MIQSEDDFFDLFEKEVSNHELSLFLGAGSSMDAGLISLFDLMNPLSKDLKIKMNEKTNLFNIAQFYIDKFGKQQLVSTLHDELKKLPKSTNLIDNLLKLNSKTIWTTNYDTIIEDKFLKLGIKSNVVYKENQIHSVENNKINIIKINGQLSDADSIVISTTDLAENKERNELLFTFLSKELATNSFLFIGYSFQDNVILSTLLKLKKIMGQFAATHFTIMKKECDDKVQEQKMFINYLEKNYNIQTLLVDDYPDIPRKVKQLRNHMINKNILLSGALWDVSEDQQEFAYSLMKELSSELLDMDGYYNLHTGMGMNIGAYFAGEAFKHIQDKNILYPERRLALKPFALDTTKNENDELRHGLVNDCKIFIFAFGDKNPNHDGESGVIKEYKEALKVHKYNAIYIPIASTGLAAEEVYDLISKDGINNYPYLSDYMEKLKSEKEPSNIVKMIKQIIESGRSYLAS
ncbi:SIR2 family protein [Pediococcus argentinicus]|uniref:NAD(+) hydrolase ThsA Sir2/TIR-associating SLOG domain-containing protein n=2 Tax=Pediococcus argentinicus TaxID=480391 RepID=A0A0R2N3P6_9LACO|nr:SIR2 family protein [Pediococcus argentinicus]KRO20520.1 hypothetical protein IV88_GL001581 [Pediococcus argentinicus]NKZ23186.1 hypothetical protein [Pediococcus argentinicus]